ncbi:hypothetical protein DFQ27_008745 [Actinomortierella ambigua]|uniref:Major facilitator superfamily (MFS) profile domain-containing protein n=1 Tax=Actinomortierella ambigua TaxID=1343610 RepID=A0A9P6QGM9_9FUNG|nr:hypothetical protein DFQ27_008745 [Actinomortierella ambigua]
MATKSPSPSSSTVTISIQEDSTVKTLHANAPPTPKTENKFDALRERLQPLLLYVVSLAQFLDIVNGASVSVALFSIAKDLHFDVGQMQWIVSAYTLSFAGLLLVAGRIGDLFGHRRVFLTGLAWFSIWSLVVSFARSPVVFSVARALQGVGAAFTIPTALALIAITYPAGPARTKALSIFGAFGAMGAVVGILLAGAFLSSIGWEWLFRLTAIISFALFLIGFISIPSSPPKATKPVIDYPGAITITASIVLLVYYISAGVDEGFADKKTLPMLIVGLILLGVFLYIETKVSHPIMPFRVWKSRYFPVSFVLTFIGMAQFQGILFYVTLIYQEVYGWNAIKTAVGFIVHSVLAVVVFTVLGRVLPRFPFKPFIVLAFLFRSVTALMFAFVDEDTSYWALPFPALIIHVFGLGFSMLPLQVTALKDAANEDQGVVGALYSAALQMGAPFGLAIFNVISAAANGTDPSVTGPVLMTGYKNALFAVAAFGGVAFLVALVFVPYDKPSLPKKPANDDVEANVAEVKEEVVEVGVPVTNDSELEQATVTKMEGELLSKELQAAKKIGA